MGLFDRRKDAKHSAATPPESGEEQSTAPPSTPPGPPPVASEVREMRIKEEPKVASEPPAPPAPKAAEPAEPAPEPAEASAPPAAAEPTSSTEIHTVEAGESLADLASRYGVAAEEIGRQNHVPPPGQIHAGQVLVITRG